jgi:hypothetical protein
MRSRWLKYALVAVLLSDVTVGCVTATPQEQPKPQPSATSQEIATPVTSTISPTQFGRAATQGWDAASRYTYELDGGPDEFGVTAGEGFMRASHPGESVGLLVSDYAKRDVDVTASMRSDRAASGGDQYVYLLARAVGSSSGYVARLRTDAAGSSWLQAVRTREGVDEPLGTEVRLDSGDALLVRGVEFRLELSGANPTSIRIKAWAANEQEPAGWQYSYIDDNDLRQPGAIGVRTYLSRRADNPPVTVKVAGFRAQTVSASSQPEVAGVSATAAPSTIRPNIPIIGTPESAAPAPTTSTRSDSPIDVVDQFYAFVEQKQLSQALELWTPHMQVSFPPADNLDERFKYTRQIHVERAALASLDDQSGRATVAITVREVLDREPFERRYVGTWQLIRNNGAWQLDQPDLIVES